MCVTLLIQAVLGELSEQAKKIDDTELKPLMNLILASDRLFLAGAGRSGIMISAFANRLVHLGLNASLINEITKPKANPGDLLIIGSGSGETGSLITYATKAKQLGVNIALITTNSSSTLANLAQCVVCLPAGTISFSQPMGSTFEQLSLLTYDSVVLALMNQLNQSSSMMQSRHANIE